MGTRRATAPLGVEEPRVHGRRLQAFREGLARAAALGRREHARASDPGTRSTTRSAARGLPEQRLARARLEDQRPQVPEDALLPQQRPRGGDVRGAERGHAERSRCGSRRRPAARAARPWPAAAGFGAPATIFASRARGRGASCWSSPMHTWAKGPTRVRLLPADRDARDDERDVRPDRPVDARPVGRDPALRARLDDVVLQERLRAALVQRERRRAGEPAHGQPQEAAGVDVAALRGGRVGGGHRRPGPLVQDLVAMFCETGPGGARRPSARATSRLHRAPGRRRAGRRERAQAARAALVGPPRGPGRPGGPATPPRGAVAQRGLGGDVRLLLRDRGSSRRDAARSTTATGFAAATSAQAAPATRASAPASASSAATSADGARAAGRPSTSPSSEGAQQEPRDEGRAPGAARAARR